MSEDPDFVSIPAMSWNTHQDLHEIKGWKEGHLSHLSLDADRLIWQTMAVPSIRFYMEEKDNENSNRIKESKPRFFNLLSAIARVKLTTLRNAAIFDFATDSA